MISRKSFFMRFSTNDLDLLSSYSTLIDITNQVQAVQAEADCTVQSQSGLMWGAQYVSSILEALANAIFLERLETSFRNEIESEPST